MYTTSERTYLANQKHKARENFNTTYGPKKLEFRAASGMTAILRISEPGISINPLLQTKADENLGPKTRSSSEICWTCDIQSCIQAT